MAFERGEFGEVLGRVEKRFTCPEYPECRQMFEGEREAMRHYHDEHRTDSGRQSSLDAVTSGE